MMIKCVFHHKMCPVIIFISFIELPQQNINQLKTGGPKLSVYVSQVEYNQIISQSYFSLMYFVNGSL